MTAEQDQERYLKAMHAVQSGVMAFMEIDPTETTPKHLRTGVNSAHISVGALAKVLVEKGLITVDELWAANADVAEADVQTYQNRLREHFGTDVTLA
ncbi:MAG: hypothetical protein ACJ786_36000 [Catenulispora sp.]